VEPLYRVVGAPVLGTGLAAALAPLSGRARIERGIRASFGPNAAAIPEGFIEQRARLWSRPTIISTLARERVTFEEELRAASALYPAIRVPVLVVCGVEDARNYQDALRLAREVPGARLRALPDTGHYVQFARPEAVVAAVEEAASAR
jgi:pimeloyl-ACP methyl ester carboxylesterase